jgi:hypothetical protein
MAEGGAGSDRGLIAPSIANPIVSVMLGALVLQERLDKNPPWHAVAAVGALCLALIGAVVISSAREQESEVEQGPLEPRTAQAQPSTGRGESQG